MSNTKALSTLFLVLTVTGYSVSSCATSGLFTKRGTVQQIETGKDGYTASMRGEDGRDFDALVSRVRMQQNYRVLQVGERVKVAGDTIHFNQRIRVLVREIK